MLACETGCHNLKLAVNESLNVSSPDFVSRLSAGVQMEGMQAMYTFCVAVMLSLILSLVVERLEGRGTPLVPTEVPPLAFPRPCWLRRGSVQGGFRCRFAWTSLTPERTWGRGDGGVQAGWQGVGEGGGVAAEGRGEVLAPRHMHTPPH